MNDIKIFENPEFGEVRTLLDEKGDVLFCASDVTKALGYTNVHGTLTRHCRGVLKRYTPTSSGEQEISYIFEPDVYRLIVKSKLPAAQEFEAWVFEEVLPTIRKHGAYASKETLLKVIEDPNSFLELLKALMGEQEKNKVLENELLLTQPKAEYYDKIVDSGLLVNFRTTSKEIGVQPSIFISILLGKGYLYRNTKGNLLPYQKYVKSGLFELKEFYRNNHAGTQTLITPKGRTLFLKVVSELTPEEIWQFTTD